MGLSRLASRSRLARVAAALLALVAAAALVDLWRWWGAQQLAARLALVADTTARDDDPPLLRFARAAVLEQRGEVDAALNAYRSLHADPALGLAARYNAANLLLRRALELRDAANPGQALTLIELAKQGYRDVLRHDPGHWDARYNLERAQRLQPEPEDMDAPMPEPRNDAERAATTMRGVAPGLP